MAQRIPIYFEVQLQQLGERWMARRQNERQSWWHLERGHLLLQAAMGDDLEVTYLNM